MKVCTALLSLHTSVCVYVCVVGGPCGLYLSVLFHVILMCTNLDNAFFFSSLV